MPCTTCSAWALVGHTVDEGKAPRRPGCARLSTSSEGPSSRLALPLISLSQPARQSGYLSAAPLLPCSHERVFGGQIGAEGQ